MTRSFIELKDITRAICVNVFRGFYVCETRSDLQRQFLAAVYMSIFVVRIKCEFLYDLNSEKLKSHSASRIVFNGKKMKANLKILTMKIKLLLSQIEAPRNLIRFKQL